MDVVKLLQDCIKKFNLDVNLLRDYAFAICVADNISGSNKKELDVDRFVEHDSELSWNEVLVSLGITPQSRGCKSLPRVQKLRVISDVLSLSLGGTIEGLILTCETSRKLLKHQEFYLNCVSYADEQDCLENLEKIKEYIDSCVNLGAFNSLYKRLKVYSNTIMQVGGFNLPDGLDAILVPEEVYDGIGKRCSASDFSSFLEKHNFSIDDYCNYVIDIYCYEIVQEVAKLMNKRFSKNEVEFNLILTRVGNFAINYLPIGTFSLNGYIKRLSILRNVPSYLSRKVNVVFSDSSSFSEMTIKGCISVLYLLRKINTGKAELVSRMEGLIDECRD